MSLEYLKQICEQEKQAEKIKQDGLAESKLIVSAATDEAAALIEKARLKADALYKETIAATNEEALTEYDKIISKANWECEMLFDIAEKNIDKAISVIVGKVVS